MDNSQLSFSYCFKEAPLPVNDYVMTVRLIPVSGQNKTLIQWTARSDNREPDPRSCMHTRPKHSKTFNRQQLQ